jgi:hypothetical protein
VLVENATNDWDNDCAACSNSSQGNQEGGRDKGIHNNQLQALKYSTRTVEAVRISQQKISRDVGRYVFTSAISTKNASLEILDNNHN